MDDLIKEIQRQLKFAENEYNIVDKRIKHGQECSINDTTKRLFYYAQINAYKNILNYYKQELL